MIVKIFRLLVLVVWLSLLPALTACNTSPLPISDSLERIIQRGKLVIATDPVYPPQSAKVEGEIRPVNTRCSPTEFTANQFTGFDVDVAVELARRLGVEPCFATPYWDQITAGNWGDHWDIHVGSMSITSERMEIFYFPQPYYTSPSAFFVQQDDDRFMQPADLAGKKIGVCLDCSYQYYLEGSLELPGVEMDFVVKDPIIVAYNDEMAALETRTDPATGFSSSTGMNRTSPFFSSAAEWQIHSSQMADSSRLPELRMVTAALPQ